MERRIRFLHGQLPSRSEPFLKYLKPGALARMRDSRISARSHRVCTIPPISHNRVSPTSSPPPSIDLPNVNMTDAFPCFWGRMYGPRCPRRKKLVAAKAVLFLGSSQSGSVADLSDPAIDVFSTDNNIVVAH